MILNMSLDLPGDGSFLWVTRLLGRTLLEHLGVVEEDIIDIEFVVGELCANVIRHARSSDGRFQVAMEYHADRVVITVTDHGAGFSFKDVLPVGAVRPDSDGGERIGGFGLDLVRSVADRLDFRRSDPHGTTVSAEKRLRYASDAAAREAAQLDRDGGTSVSVSGG